MMPLRLFITSIMSLKCNLFYKRAIFMPFVTFKMKKNPIF